MYSIKQNGTRGWCVKIVSVIKYPQCFTVKKRDVNGAIHFTGPKQKADLFSSFGSHLLTICDSSYRGLCREQAVNTEIGIAGKSFAFLCSTHSSLLQDTAEGGGTSGQRLWVPPSTAEGAAGELSSGPWQVQPHNPRPVLIYNSGACSLSVMAFLFLMGSDGPVKVLEIFFYPGFHFLW